MGQNLTIRLDAAVPVFEGGDTTWPIFVPRKNFTGPLRSVSVSVHGLFAQVASDFRLALRHAGQEVLLFDGDVRAPMALGVPARLPGSEAGYGFEAPTPAQGAGHDYIFSDANETAVNVAEGRPATQSSTAFDGSAGRAVDGRTDGHYSTLSVTHTALREESGGPAWWQVDLGSVPQPIAAVRVWGRTQQPDADEVQVVTVSARQALTTGDFRLNVTANEVSGLTQPVSVTASAEDLRRTLEALPHVSGVAVATAPTHELFSVRWLVTFTSVPGNVPEMQAVDVSVPAIGGEVRVTTARDGAGSTWYNYNSGRVERVVGSLTPSFLVLLDDVPPANATTADVLGSAVWYTPLSGDRRLLTVRVPGNVSARVVRVQSASADPLCLAEVQVFNGSLSAIGAKPSGSPILGGAYAPSEPLDVAFRDAAPDGDWALILRSVASQSTGPVTPPANLSLHGGNGSMLSEPAPEAFAIYRPPGASQTGAVSDWILHLTDAAGVRHDFRVDAYATVLSLPVHGSLLAQPKAIQWPLGSRGPPNVTWAPLPVGDGTQRYAGLCLGGRCRAEVGEVGVGLSTSPDGAGAAFNMISGPREVLFSPPPAFSGDDAFTFELALGQFRSPPARIRVLVRDCRKEWCGEVRW